MRRILGLLLIIRAITPLLVIAVIGWGVWQIGADVQAAVARPVASIEAELVGLGATFDAAEATVLALQAQVMALTEAVQSLRLPELPALPTSISLPRLTIPSPTIKVPNSVSVTWADFSYVVEEWVPNDCGIFDFLCDAASWVLKTVTKVVSYPSSLMVGTRNLRLSMPTIPALSLPVPAIFTTIRDGLNDMLAALFSPFHLFDGAFDSIGALVRSVQAVPDRVNAVVGAGTAFVEVLLVAVTRWMGLILVLSVVISLLWFVSITTTFIGYLTRGWRMLFGSTP